MTRSRQSKVLRIGILHDGKIVQERLIRPGDSVTVGESGKNTFVFPKTHLEDVEHRLFEASNHGYVLRLTEEMKGRVSTGGAVVSLERLAGDPTASRKDDLVLLPLAEQDRGKIIIDGVAVLFQFVQPPPVRAAVPLQLMDFRPRLLEDDDPVFLGFLGTWSALALVLVIWVWNTEPKAFELSDLPERITKLVVVPPDVIPDVEPDPEPEIEVAEVVRPIERAPRPAPTEGVADSSSDDGPAPRDEEDVKNDVLAKSDLLLELIGSLGDSPETVAGIWSGDDVGFEDLDKALDDAGGVTTNAAVSRLRDGSGGTDRAADIDDLVGVGGGKGRSIEGPSVSIAGTVRTGPSEIQTSKGDVGRVEKTIRKYAGQLNYCYEKRLKVLPTLEGRVEISWEVEDGVVVGNPLIVANSTGDGELAECVQQKIRRWRFEGFAGEANNPFIFQAK